VNAPLVPEVLSVQGHASQGLLPLATEGVMRYAWEHRFGSMLIEVIGDDVYVDGRRVEPADVTPSRMALDGSGR